MFYYWNFDEDDIVPFFTLLFIFLAIMIIGIALTDNTKYGYIDLDGNEGTAEYCKENYCEVDNKTITVKEFWKIENKNEEEIKKGK